MTALPKLSNQCPERFHLDKDPNELLTERQLQAERGRSASFWQRKRWKGDGPVYIKLGDYKGAAVLYRRGDVDAWIESCSRTNTTNLKKKRSD